MPADQPYCDEVVTACGKSNQMETAISLMTTLAQPSKQFVNNGCNLFSSPSPLDALSQFGMVIAFGKLLEENDGLLVGPSI